MKIAEAIKGRDRVAVKKATAFLDKLPKDEVFPTKDVDGRFPVSVRNLRHDPELDGYFHHHAGTKYWGSKPAITAFRAALSKGVR